LHTVVVQKFHDERVAERLAGRQQKQRGHVEKLAGREQKRRGLADALAGDVHAGREQSQEGRAQVLAGRAQRLKGRASVNQAHGHFGNAFKQQAKGERLAEKGKMWQEKSKSLSDPSPLSSGLGSIVPASHESLASDSYGFGESEVPSEKEASLSTSAGFGGKKPASLPAAEDFSPVGKFTSGSTAATDVALDDTSPESFIARSAAFVARSAGINEDDDSTERSH